MKKNISREEEFEEEGRHSWCEIYTYDVSISVREDWGKPQRYTIKRKDIGIGELKLLVNNLENISKNFVIEDEGNTGGYKNA